MTTKLLTNQLRAIMNDPVEGFMVELVDESSLFNWKVYIEGPKDTTYEGGVFQLLLSFPKDYPMSPPTLKFVSDFWHPNVFPDGKVCMSILHPPGEDAMSGELPQERWLPTQSVTTIILSLLSLLNDPNCASPANVDASVEWRKDRPSYKKRCLQLVEKANKEKPEHVVIPHPDTNENEHKKRVQKWKEMNKELDYDDFFDEEMEAETEEGGGEEMGEAEEEEEEENENENEFLESENEEINSEGESAKKRTTQDDGAEKKEIIIMQDEKKDREKEKGKEKVIEIEVEKKEKPGTTNNVTATPSSNSDNNNNNNLSSDPVANKKSKKNKNRVKKEKCIVM